jgi:hypothetical protein
MEQGRVFEMIPRRSLLILAGVASAAAILGAPAAASAAPTPASQPLSASATPTLPGTITPAAYGPFTNYASRAGAGMHSCRNNTCSVNGWAYLGDPLTDYCYNTGQYLEENPYWDFVYNTRTRKSGWTNENWLQDKSQSKHC